MRKKTESDARKNALYTSARAEAQLRADASGRDVGLEWLGDDAWGHWHVFGLPNRENRYGYEARCEAVMCSDLGKIPAGHGPCR